MKRLAGIAAMLTLVLAASAAAQPAPADRSDNTYTFSYDASSGTISAEASSRRVSKTDPVDFLTVIREAEGTGPGLIGKVQLRLNADKRITYDGWLTLTIVDDDGDIAYRRNRPVDIHLAPRPGRRRASVGYAFDLPTGDYAATGTFEPAE